ncbi:S8 family serine peptidase [Schaalia meyeri]|uniref:S8 family serine peptidase n=2 Tax=Schaalia meyeri TaxID=52773 RepID=A0AAP9Y6N7_9ACTO|nr:S8 family serine peptidase [Schaalia meyeri]
MDRARHPDPVSAAPCTPRSHRLVSGWVGRPARALAAAASVLALTVGALVLVPASARADDVITTQEYFSYYHLDTARAKGYTGKGVTIALIDGPVELSDPELKGANITDKSRCTINATIASRYHGSEMAAILASQAYGVAPEATILSYQKPTSDDTPSESCKEGGKKLHSDASLINSAIDDGAQIISASFSTNDTSDDLKWAIARAMSRGVIIVNSAGNTGTDNNHSQLSQWSGVVGVSAITSDGKFAKYSSWGNGVTTAAVGGPLKVRDFDTGKTAVTNGSSNSAAIVSGMLALARQKWPDATANQTLQVLTHTGLNPNHEWNKYTGYGAANIGPLVNTDPSQYPDENPLAQKEGGSKPTASEVQDYADGLADPRRTTSDSSYAYRGTDDSIFAYINPGDERPIHLGTSPRYHRK